MDTPNARPLALATRLHHRPGRDPRAPRPHLTPGPGPHHQQSAAPPTGTTTAAFHSPHTRFRGTTRARLPPTHAPIPAPITTPSDSPPPQAGSPPRIGGSRLSVLLLSGAIAWNLANDLSVILGPLLPISPGAFPAEEQRRRHGMAVAVRRAAGRQRQAWLQEAMADPKTVQKFCLPSVVALSNP